MSYLTDLWNAIDLDTDLWIIALAMSAIGAAFIYLVHARHVRAIAAREKAWRARSSLRSRGA